MDDRIGMPALVIGSGTRAGTGSAATLGGAAPELVVRPVPRPLGPDDVLVRVAATGVCGTDRGIVLGEFPALPGVVLGHEAAGEVAATGAAVSSVRRGERVVVNPTYFCGRCRPCRRNLAAHCVAKEGREVGVDRDGTMAGYVVVPERFAHPLPAGVSYRRAALVEPLACVLNNLTAAAPRWDDRVLVVGAGPIGSLCAMVLAVRGARVSVAERDAGRLALARELLPSAVGVLAVGADGLAAVPELRRAAPDVIVDTTGLLLGEAMSVVATGGTVVVMGEREPATARIALRPLVTRGVRVVGAGPYPPHLFEAALDLAPGLPLESLVTHALPLERYPDAFALLGAPLPPAGRGGDADAKAGGGRDAGAAPVAGGYAAMKVLLVSDPALMAGSGG
ncbi:zinc-dependent alcohol dehydrogenase [Allostreptomyces psammosilenae]|uniref:2-deoxy-scyllo-inosamine dehydrogenase n=1 Tax=Allostreptomyces psammosilenae TaxID=1892865 RepID=A0A853AAP8_9ACTN|nr:alcohol dehydrogenase catalytic domain-containing protein [Allostreptomyces psammosilenae]NYI07588.1 threonine dehydrogenase-like Zn-dependent dehydrogenase [Allostreptomyces psammosilenae]